LFKTLQFSADETSMTEILILTRKKMMLY